MNPLEAALQMLHALNRSPFTEAEHKYWLACYEVVAKALVDGQRMAQMQAQKQVSDDQTTM